MKKFAPRYIQSKEFINTAFAITVMLSIFYAISTMPARSILVITALICLSTFYILLGVYGFQFIQAAADLKTSLAYVIIQIGIAASLIALEKGVGYQALIFLPLVAQTVFLFSDNAIFLVNLLIIVLYSISQVFSFGSQINTNSLLTFLAAQIFVILFTQMILDEERARINAEILATNLKEANTRLKEYASKVEELAKERERIRLAREIHDGVGHNLTTIYMQLQAAEALFKSDPQKAIGSLSTAKELSHEALADVRNSVSELREGNIKRLSLLSRINKLSVNVTKLGIKCTVRYLGKPRSIPSNSNQTIFRLAQEGISNALKHSNAKHIHIKLDFSHPTMITFFLKDDGVGTDDIQAGYGLIGMKERVLLMGGKFAISSRRGAGLEIKVEVPG